MEAACPLAALLSSILQSVLTVLDCMYCGLVTLSVQLATSAGTSIQSHLPLDQRGRDLKREVGRLRPHLHAN